MDKFNGFSQQDFDVFGIDGLESRMDGIKQLIRPKLEWLGQHYAATLSAATGDEMFFHVAKHARRTVNPPNDTWVAWANDKRGYKKHPHFQIGLWGSHMFVWYAIIYESPHKQSIGEIMESNLDLIVNEIPADFHWSLDHMQPESTPQSELGRDGLLQLFKRLQTVKSAELLCGITIDRKDPIVADGKRLLRRIDQTFAVLTKLYSLGTQVRTPISSK